MFPIFPGGSVSSVSGNIRGGGPAVTIEGVQSPGDLDLKSVDGTVVIVGDDAADDIDFSVPNVPTTGEKAALAGTFGAPGAANKYLTETDTAVALADKSRPSPWVAAADLAGRSIADLGTKDHDLLTGLADDDHTQYTLASGARNFTGPQGFVAGTRVAPGVGIVGDPNTGLFGHAADQLGLAAGAAALVIANAPITLVSDGPGDGADIFGKVEDGKDSTGAGAGGAGADWVEDAGDGGAGATQSINANNPGTNGGLGGLIRRRAGNGGLGGTAEGTATGGDGGNGQNAEYVAGDGGDGGNAAGAGTNGDGGNGGDVVLTPGLKGVKGTGGSGGADGADGKVLFASNMSMNGDFDIAPTTTGEGELGTDALKWKRIRAVDIVADDIHLKGRGQDYTLFEGENGLLLKNNKTQKTYRMIMEEVA